jgi:hypothetical protein
LPPLALPSLALLAATLVDVVVVGVVVVVVVVVVVAAGVAVAAGAAAERGASGDSATKLLGKRPTRPRRSPFHQPVLPRLNTCITSPCVVCVCRSAASIDVRGSAAESRRELRGHSPKCWRYLFERELAHCRIAFVIEFRHYRALVLCARSVCVSSIIGDGKRRRTPPTRSAQHKNAREMRERERCVGRRAPHRSVTPTRANHNSLAHR